MAQVIAGKCVCSWLRASAHSPGGQVRQPRMSKLAQHGRLEASGPMGPHKAEQLAVRVEIDPPGIGVLLTGLFARLGGTKCEHLRLRSVEVGNIEVEVALYRTAVWPCRGDVIGRQLKRQRGACWTDELTSTVALVAGVFGPAEQFGIEGSNCAARHRQMLWTRRSAGTLATRKRPKATPSSPNTMSRESTDHDVLGAGRRIGRARVREPLCSRRSGERVGAPLDLRGRREISTERPEIVEVSCIAWSPDEAVPTLSRRHAKRPFPK